MSLRDKFKGLRHKQTLPESEFVGPRKWTVGDDCPLFFDSKSLKKEVKRIIYLNYKSGNITREEQIEMLRLSGMGTRQMRSK